VWVPHLSVWCLLDAIGWARLQTLVGDVADTCVIYTASVSTNSYDRRHHRS
jgi:hypothetical protein